MTAVPELVWDPEALTAAQRASEACAVCSKRWPLPRCRVGVLPDQRPLYACPECAVLTAPGCVITSQADPGGTPVKNKLVDGIVLGIITAAGIAVLMVGWFVV